MNQKYILKIVFVGDPAVGKTSLIQSFVKDAFPSDYLPTIGANFYTKNIRFQFQNEKFEVNLAIWDIAGQTAWLNMRSTYYRGANGIFLIGDISDPDTFGRLEEFWIPDLKKNFTSIEPIILLMNKKDLVDNPEVIKIESLKERSKISKFLITSAKTGYNVKDAFIEMIQLCLEMAPIKPI